MVVAGWSFCIGDLVIDILTSTRFVVVVVVVVVVLLNAVCHFLAFLVRLWKHHSGSLLAWFLWQ